MAGNKSGKGGHDHPHLPTHAIWLVPAAFVTFMAIGGALGLSGIALLHMETMIALSVFVLGAFVALQIKPQIAVTLLLAAFFATFHGGAHGAELPANAEAISFLRRLPVGDGLAPRCRHYIRPRIGTWPENSRSIHAKLKSRMGPAQARSWNSYATHFTQWERDNTLDV